MPARTILIAAALFPLASCASTTKLFRLQPPATLTQPCPPLVRLDGPATLGTMNAVVVENYGLYHQCAARHRALADWLE